MNRTLLLLALLAAACSSEKKPAEEAPPPAPAPAPVAATTSPSGEQVVDITVTEEGYVPKDVAVDKGRPVRMRVTRKTDKTCATEVVIAEHGIDVKLPLDQTVDIVFTPKTSGTLRYGCAMDHMISSVITVR